MNRIPTIVQPLIVHTVVGLSVGAQLLALAVLKLMAVDTRWKSPVLA